MQGDETYLHAARADLFQQFRREMQTRRRRGDRTIGPREDGLIAFLVLWELAVALDVRRQRNFAQPVKFVADVRRAGKLQPPMSFVVGFKNRGANFGFRISDRI